MRNTFYIPADPQEIRNLIAANKIQIDLLLKEFRKGFSFNVFYVPSVKDPSRDIFSSEQFLRLVRDAADYQSMQTLAERYIAHNLLLDDTLSKLGLGSQSNVKFEING